MLLSLWIDLTGALAVTLPDKAPSAAAGQEPPVAGDLYLAAHRSDDPLISPLTADLSGLPPMLIQTATGDPQ
jgi:acetyl esterase/lipase